MMITRIPIKYLVGIFGIPFLAVFLFLQLCELAFFSSISYSITLVALLFILVNRLGWWRLLWRYKESWVNHAVFPDVQGTYTGALKYNWGEEQGQREITIVIEQTLIHTQVFLKSHGKSLSDSIVCAEIKKAANGDWRIYYAYLNENRDPEAEESNDHYGFAQLNIIIGNDLALSGRYFTDRKTSGSIEVKRVSRQTEKDRSFPLSS